MLSANVVMPPRDVAKYSCASGARSWMISSIAVPSSALPTWPGRTVTGPRSPDAWLAARFVTPFESTPILTPAPRASNAARAANARCVMSASHPHFIEQLRIDLLLGCRARFLFGDERLDLRERLGRDRTGGSRRRRLAAERTNARRGRQRGDRQKEQDGTRESHASFILTVVGLDGCLLQRQGRWPSPRPAARCVR